MEKKKHVAIILAAGSGSRMGGNIPKQFQRLGEKPVICYSLQAFEESFIDEIILVVAEGTEEDCRTRFVNKYGYSKVTKIVGGGEERYVSVYRGLCAIDECDYVYIHDGARPFVDVSILLRANECVALNGACVAGMPVRDTVKIADDMDFVVETPLRSNVWEVQTPQAFSYNIIKEAYDKLFDQGDIEGITDDAMVVERMTDYPVKLFEGSYRNMKITTPHDMVIAEMLLQ